MRVLIFWCGFALGAASQDPVSAYAGQLAHVFGDLKRPLACLEGCMTQDNYEAILEGIQNKLHCNGVRIGIDPKIDDPKAYSPVYKAVVKYAHQHRLRIYASPLGTGHFGKSREQFADWIVAYANEFQPHFLGVFNEARYDDAAYVQIARLVRSRLTYKAAKLVGPDKQHLAWTLKSSPEALGVFDIIGSHNAAGDNSATEANWLALSRAAGSKEVWSTENPCSWPTPVRHNQQFSHGKHTPPATCATFGGLKHIFESGGPVQGLVLYLAYPKSVKANGELTPKGRGIAEGIAGSGFKHLQEETAVTDEKGTVAEAAPRATVWLQHSPALLLLALVALPGLGMAAVLLVRRRRRPLLQASDSPSAGSLQSEEGSLEAPMGQ